MEDRPHSRCETGPSGPLCATVTDAPQIVLRDVLMVRGKLDPIARKLEPSLAGKVVLSTACFTGTLSRTAFSQSSIGSRYRFYGFSRNPRFWLQPIYIVADLVSGSGNP
jgi:hypothetical protein